MPVRVFFVCLFSRHFYADNDDKCAEYIGSGMYGVGNHGAGFPDDACKQFDKRKDQVYQNTDSGNLYGERFILVFFHVGILLT